MVVGMYVEGGRECGEGIWGWRIDVCALKGPGSKVVRSALTQRGAVLVSVLSCVLSGVNKVRRSTSSQEHLERAAPTC